MQHATQHHVRGGAVGGPKSLNQSQAPSLPQPYKMWKLFATSRQEFTRVTMCIMERGTRRRGVPHGEFWHGNSGEGGVSLLEVIKGEGSRG